MNGLYRLQYIRDYKLKQSVNRFIFCFADIESSMEPRIIKQTSGKT